MKSRWAAFDLDELIEIQFAMHQFLEDHRTYDVPDFNKVLTELNVFLHEAYHLVDLKGEDETK